jgi:hypothetical protein
MFTIIARSIITIIPVMSIIIIVNLLISGLLFPIIILSIIRKFRCLSTTTGAQAA